MSRAQRQHIIKFWKQGRYSTATIARVVGVAEPDACKVIADERETRLKASEVKP